MDLKFWQRKPRINADEIMDSLKKNYGYDKKYHLGLDIDNEDASYAWGNCPAAGEYVVELSVYKIRFSRSELQALAETASKKGKARAEVRAMCRDSETKLTILLDLVKSKPILDFECESVPKELIKLDTESMRERILRQNDKPRNY